MPHVKRPVSIERLKTLLAYEPDTGLFRWRVSRGGQTAGDVAGSVDPSNGYIKVYADGRNQYGHRLAWAFVKGEWLEDQVDHRDLDRTNNRFSNLRPATNGQNMSNSARVCSSSGYKGVYWHKGAGRWVAQIVCNKQHHYLGLFDSLEVAHEAWREAAERLHGEFARAAR